ncbi:hypothetical protein [Microvirga sp. M2]|uniref:hypothetical protein n=1 Tax=Microvirga sp. M2 TaxID=3073270 RepID=UPI0039C4530C
MESTFGIDAMPRLGAAAPKNVDPRDEPGDDEEGAGPNAADMRVTAPFVLAL